MSEYDHHRKAGNQGDVVKHPALIAALATFLNGRHGSITYVDAFSGHARHPLRNDAEFEWQKGIGQIESTLSENAHFRRWQEHYLRAEEWKNLYPGSSAIAFDVLSSHSQQFTLHLCDRASQPLASLESYFEESVKTGIVQIHTAQVDGDETHWTHEFSKTVDEADFLFLDPPGLKNGINKTFPAWKLFKDILQRRRNAATLLWLPTVGLQANWTRWETGHHHKKVAAAKKLGYDTTYVRWNSGQSKAGCKLIYNFCKPAIRDAIDATIRLTNWEENVSRTVTSAHDTKKVVIHT